MWTVMLLIHLPTNSRAVECTSWDFSSVYSEIMFTIISFFQKLIKRVGKFCKIDKRRGAIIRYSRVCALRGALTIPWSHLRSEKLELWDINPILHQAESFGESGLYWPKACAGEFWWCILAECFRGESVETMLTFPWRKVPLPVFTVLR